MIKNWKRRMAVLLATAIVLTSNTIAFAGQTVGAEEATAYTLSSDGVPASPTTPAEDIYYEDITTPVSSLKDDPTTWSKDPAQARFTYLMVLPQLSGYDDNLTVSGDKANMLIDGKTVKRRALTGWDMPIWVGVSYNAVKIEGDYYVVYAYGISNEFDGGSGYFNSYNAYRHADMAGNNYYGMTPDGVPAGVFDYTEFTWYKKDGGLKNNAKIVFEASIVKKGTNGEYEKQRIYEVKGLTTKACKNKMHATVSFDAINGKWVPLKYNTFLPKASDPSATKNKPYFYPQFQCKKSYRDVNGVKVKADRDDKKLLRTINKELKKKDRRIYYEIRRRPIAGSVSDDYLDDGLPTVPFKYVSLIGDELDFKKNGKLKNAKLQFKSVTYKRDEDMDVDEIDTTVAAGKANTTAKAIGYYLTHVLTTKDVKKSDQGSADLQKRIENGEYRKKEKTDLWIYTRDINGYDTLLAYGANDLQGVAAFRKRDDRTIGTGYYKSDKEYFISSLDE